MITETEVAARFACFGSQCAVHVAGAGAEDAVVAARRDLVAWHHRFTRFAVTSELSHLNADPRDDVPVTPLMARFVQAAVDAAVATGGLVDPTLVRPLEELGYRRDLGVPLPLPLALKLAPARRPGAPNAAVAWRDVRVDRDRGVVSRPPRVALDSGGIAKGVFADVLAERMRDHEAFAIDCGGDLRIGGAAGVPREIQVQSPFGEDILHTFELTAAAVGTSGIGRRSWLDSRGRPAHHLLDPATLKPAFTGIVQVTAIAPTAAEAEVRAKAALLSGPATAPDWLPDGGAIVYDDGAFDILEPRSAHLHSR